MASTQLSTTRGSRRRDQVLARLRQIFYDLTGVDQQQIDVGATFFELGADSLILVQASHAIENQFQIPISFRLLLEDLTSLSTLATYIDLHLTPDIPLVELPHHPVAPPERRDSSITSPAPAQLQPETLVAPHNGETVVERVIAQQLQMFANIVSQQLGVLRTTLVEEHAAHLPTPPAPKPARQTHVTSPETRSSPDNGQTDAPAQTQLTPIPTPSAAFGPYRPLLPGSTGNLSPRQQQHLDALIARYTARTQELKRRTQASRSVLADSRVAVGFRRLWKELVYPIIGARSCGSIVWDVDNNAYVDLTMGFGVNLFGHSPEFINTKLQEQLQQGIHIGTQSELAGEVAALISELTGMERVAFCNTGSEAVMTAVRLARAATRRTKIALFAGAYHGNFDGVLARAHITNGRSQPIPIAPGIPPHMIEDVLVLDYASPQALDILRTQIHELAAILVEPVQSRRPELQPKEFLHELRRMADLAQTALIFDEVITGFRIHPGGAQAWFGVQADIATYGKIVGGGMPIGVVAGKSTYLDAIDGGTWAYGDDSYPAKDLTFFAGTFCKHPLSMAAAWATLHHLKASGPGLQQQLNQRTAQLARRLNSFFEHERVPIQIASFGSLFNFDFGPDMSFVSLFFYHLLDKGIHIWEGRNCFLSTAHSNEDIETIVQAVQQTILEMRAGGFLPEAQQPPARVEPVTNVKPAAVVVGTVEAACELPLTEAQQPLWVLTQLGDDASRAYHMSLTLDLRGDVHVPALRQAIQGLVARHEALRTTFSSDGTSQLIHPALSIDIPDTDFSQRTSTDRDAAVSAWLTEIVQQPFDLVHGPVVRAHIARLGHERHLLVLTVHHLVADGWSNGIMLSDLAALYSAARQGVPPQLPNAMGYSEYVRRQIAQQQTPAMVAAREYWLAQFADSVPILELPIDHPRPPLQLYTANQQRLMIGAALCGQLKQLSARCGCTLFTTLLAGFQLLLHRLTAQNDLVVGIPAAGQMLLGAVSLVGHCVNLLPIRSRITGSPPFAHYLATTKLTVLEAFEHQRYPFDALVKQLKLTRDPSRLPFVTAFFNLDQAGAPPEFADLLVEVVTNPPGAIEFDIKLNVTEINGELLLEADYNVSLFEPETIARWLRHLQTLFEAFTARSDQSITTLPLLDEAALHQILVEWNSTAAEYPDQQCLHHLFEAQVRRTPNATALIFEELTLSYAQVDTQANQLAHHLQSLGVGPDVLVGVCMERSVETVVALLAILKAGGAYVPLDPSYPATHLAFLLADTRLSFLLTKQPFVSLLPAHQATVIYLDADWPTIAQQPTTPVTNHSTPDHVAYVMYTSGSLGQPKGVAVAQRQLLNRFAWMWRTFPCAPDEVACQRTTLNFSVSIWELLGPLMQGVPTVLVPDAIARDPVQLIRMLEAHRVTRIVVVPSLLHAILDVEKNLAHRLRYLRLWSTCGEPLTTDLAELFRERLPHARLINQYGASEVNDITYYPVDQPEARGTLVPIGRPIANTRIYLLDHNLQPVPIGVPGILHVACVSPARGYLNQPGATAERFVPNPFSTEPGMRLYNMGDVARYRPDGTIEYVGRRDHQVKLRGMRVDLSGIEAILKQHPNVEQAVAVIQDTGRVYDDRRIVAYVVPKVAAEASVAGGWSFLGGGMRPQPTLSVDEVQQFLRERVPDYMVPEAILILRSLPLTPNGKIYRQALPMPDDGPREKKPTFTAPRNTIEQTLATIWQEVLQREQVGIDDNFFDIGGHSLLAVQLVKRLNETFNVELSAVEFFEHADIRSLAAYLRHEQEEAPSLQDVQEQAEIHKAARKRRRQLRQADQLATESEGVADE